MAVTKESGFSLVELSIVVLITGVLMGGAFSLLKPYLDSAYRNTTKERMENISQALALYAQNYGRLPCPANPSLSVTDNLYGTPINSGANGTRTDQDCGAIAPSAHIGMVPFRALGFSEEQAKDSYGNLITYAVSPIMAAQTLSRNVHAYCRTDKWYDTAASTANLNENKARICCPNLATSLVLTNVTVLGDVNGGSGSRLYMQQPILATDVTPSVIGTDYLITTTLPHSSVPANDNRHLTAFILVSHGRNGDGAYIPHTSISNPVTSNPASVQEAANFPMPNNVQTNEITFVSRPLSTGANTNYFDDIVMWRTNDQLVSAFSNDSCSRP